MHAKGGGAHGIFEATHDISELCCTKMFNKGKMTPVTVRFSTVGGESGSHDAARDPRGFSIKFRTEEGNMDWVFNSTPVFFLRDPAKFPHFIHTQKRHPDSHLTHADDSTHFWDYVGQNPESVHQMMWLMGPRGIPKSWRHMQGYSGHTFKFVNDKGEWKYCQIHILSDQGVECFTSAEAAQQSPDCHQKDLFEAIQQGNYPSWKVKFQAATHQELTAAGVNPFDLTQIWPHAKFPLKEMGKLTLNQNVQNYFAEIEQIAFTPAHLVDGFEPSADPVLQSRLFSYPDTHRHRIGVNYQQLPINAPSNIQHKMFNFQRDGQSAFVNQGNKPLHLSSLNPPELTGRQYGQDDIRNGRDGHAISYLSGVTRKDFENPKALWNKVFTEQDRKTWIETVSGHMSTTKDTSVLARAISVWHQVDADMASQLAQKVGVATYEKDLAKMRFIGSHNYEAGLSALEMFAELYPDRWVGTSAPPTLPKEQIHAGEAPDTGEAFQQGSDGHQLARNGHANGQGHSLVDKVKSALRA